MKTFLCVVSPRFPENYLIGVQARTWGVERGYENRIRQTSVGDELVFIADRAIRSIHRIESSVYEKSDPLWPPKDGDPFPFRIKISEPLYKGSISNEVFRTAISFMAAVEAWGGTIQGISGVFNNRLTDADVAFIKSQLKQVSPSSPSLKSSKDLSDIGAAAPANLSALQLPPNTFLPSLGLKPMSESDNLLESSPAFGGNIILCKDNDSGDHVAVDFNRGIASTDNLIRVLQYMSWMRQSDSAKNNIKGVILTESSDTALKQVVSEVPNVSLQHYRIGIQLVD